MKQVLTAVFVFGLLGAATAAQAQPAVGVRVGFNSATVSSSNDSGTDFKMKPGLVAGVFVEVPVAPGFAFQPEFLFSQEGAKIEDSGDTAKIHLNFVQIPLLAHIKLGKSPAALLVGPSIGVRTSAKIKFDGGEQDFKDEVKKTNVGLVTGVDVHAGRALVDLRYTWGLTNLNKDSSDPEKDKSRVFSASVGVRF